jgi:hypothetical protein
VVIIDSPPLNIVTDPTIRALVDGVVSVERDELPPRRSTGE